MARMTRRATLLHLLFPLLLCAAAAAQAATAEEHRAAAETLSRWRGAVTAFDPEANWLPDGSVWFTHGRGQDREYVVVTADGDVRRDRDPEALGLTPQPRTLEPSSRVGRSRSGGRACEVVFENALTEPVELFWVTTDGGRRSYGTIAPQARRAQGTYAGHVFVAQAADGQPAGIFAVARGGGIARIDAESRRIARDRARGRTGDRRRPGGDGLVFVRDHDVWLRGDDDEPARLTDDGRADDGFRGRVVISPNDSHALAMRVVPGERHLVHVVEAAPDDQLQPKLHEFSYRKPGDRIDAPRPVLFDLATRRVIEVDPAPFANAWSLDRVRWAPDGSQVFCLFNERGHQRLCVYAIDAETGAVRTVLEERSETFVDYSQKLVLHWLEDGWRFLWASERDGWNHLYLCDARTGELTQVTRGEWLVRRLEHVDEAAGQLWFAAHGLHPDQDPYHTHLARIGLDGRDLLPLTTADGDHEWQFSPDRSRLVARWSRVDHPWVTELRRASDGALLAELGRDDTSELMERGYRPPERFVAKGRDGETDIHGMLIVPSSFDPARRYPVVESIYAGPHGQHVPKRWTLSLRERRLAELGFVVVQIDGMGTNWRRKSFHDVCWRNLKDAGLPDRIAWLRAAAAERPWLDLERVGIFGGSAGGQNALGALLHHGDFYRAAAADCGCHDNRMDKIWWNEAWMGWPLGDWYADSSNVTHAGKLRGDLLLTVGELDRNVDPASTMQVVDALIRAERDFELIVVPGAGHGVGERPYLVRRRCDFFRRALGPVR